MTHTLMRVPVHLVAEIQAVIAAADAPATDDAFFLASMLARAEAGERVTLAEVSRLRRMADWADAPPCPGWDGTLDAGETRRAVEDAKGRMGK
jgi:hypothetical protein